MPNVDSDKINYKNKLCLCLTLQTSHAATVWLKHATFNDPQAMRNGTLNKPAA